jgi:hypothetical protein
MKKLLLASLFAVAVGGLQPVLAAGGPAHLCEKANMLCACGKLPGAMFQCCHAHAKCDCSAGLPNCKYH